MKYVTKVNYKVQSPYFTFRPMGELNRRVLDPFLKQRFGEEIDEMVKKSGEKSFADLFEPYVQLKEYEPEEYNTDKDIFEVDFIYRKWKTHRGCYEIFEGDPSDMKPRFTCTLSGMHSALRLWQMGLPYWSKNIFDYKLINEVKAYFTKDLFIDTVEEVDSRDPNTVYLFIRRNIANMLRLPNSHGQTDDAELDVYKEQPNDIAYNVQGYMKYFRIGGEKPLWLLVPWPKPGSKKTVYPPGIPDRPRENPYDVPYEIFITFQKENKDDLEIDDGNGDYSEYEKEFKRYMENSEHNPFEANVPN